MQTTQRTPNGLATDWHNSIGTATPQVPKAAKPAGPHGSTEYPLVQQIADGIAVHGLAWAVRHYCRKLPQWQARALLRAAYLG